MLIIAFEGGYGGPSNNDPAQGLHTLKSGPVKLPPAAPGRATTIVTDGRGRARSPNAFYVFRVKKSLLVVTFSQIYVHLTGK